jgi:hypothetical protein
MNSWNKLASERRCRRACLGVEELEGRLTPAAPNPLNLSTLTPPAGFVVNGTNAGDQAGNSLRSAGDVNGDGFDDVIVSAPFASPNGRSGAGSAYVVFGGDFTSSTTQLGTFAADSLTGTGAGDVLVGRQGDDTLVGRGGPDVLLGGQGDDALAVRDAGFLRVRGGGAGGDTPFGDTLRLDGSNGVGFALDLTALPGGRLTGIDTIDLSDPAPFTLTLDAHTVLALTHHNTLRVKADLGDVINKGPGWTATGTQLIDGLLYQVFTQGAATLEVGGQVAPAITGITSGRPDGAYGAGKVIPIIIAFSEPVTLSGGPLVLDLNDGGSVVFAPFTAATSTTGLYTVVVGQDSPRLDSVALLAGGATLRDQVGNDAALTIPAGLSLKDLNDLVIDAVAPAPAPGVALANDTGSSSTDLKRDGIEGDLPGRDGRSPLRHGGEG